MFIELLVVGVILSILYSSGYLQFNSGYALAISIAVALVASFLGFLTTHFIARTLVDRMFGFASWNPKAKPVKKAGMDPAEVLQLQGLSEQDLRKSIKARPNDAQLSRQISEIYLQRGQIERFVEERLRAIQAGLLTREQVCAVYNRLADVRTKEGRNQEAVHFLQQIIVTYPNTVEARNAQQRCTLLSDSAALEVSEQNA
ncbi:MAG: hypothetical protein ACR2IE_01140 [Candidatus Sumerlaeaceae bacterium]